jgi:hypothetical protein
MIIFLLISNFSEENFRPDTTIDMQIFELDRIFSQMVQDCLSSLPNTSPPLSNSSILNLQITPQHQQIRSILPNKPIKPPRKSIECLYMTPTVNKQRAPVVPPCCSTLNIDRRSRSTSNIFLATQKSVSSSFLLPNTHKFQETIDKNIHIKMHKSENDLIIAMQENQQQKNDLLTLCENEKEYEQENIQELTKQDHIQNKSQTIDIQIINNNKQDNNDDDELSWPQQPLSTNSSTQTGGIKKIVRNGLKLFIIQPQQQHKRSGK